MSPPPKTARRRGRRRSKPPSSTTYLVEEATGDKRNRSGLSGTTKLSRQITFACSLLALSLLYTMLA